MIWLTAIVRAFIAEERAVRKMRAHAFDGPVFDFRDRNPTQGDPPGLPGGRPPRRETVSLPARADRFLRLLVQWSDECPYLRPCFHPPCSMMRPLGMEVYRRCEVFGRCRVDTLDRFSEAAGSRHLDESVFGLVRRQPAGRVRGVVQFEFIDPGTFPYHQENARLRHGYSW